MAIGGLIAAYVSFAALFVTMGVLSALATAVQARVSWVQEHAAAR